MAVEVFLPSLDDVFYDKARITDNNMISYPADEEISTGDLLNLVQYHESKILPKLKKKRDYFFGNHKMLKAPKKPKYKPDNRLIFNFPKKAVTTFNGFFIGTPVQIDSDNEAADSFITDWTNENNFKDVSSEVSKQASIYGRSYFYVYTNADSKTCVAPADPLRTFMIYNDTISRDVKYAVHYKKNSDGALEIELLSDSYDRTFVDSITSNSYLQETQTLVNPFPVVPIIEVPENDERMALCDDIITLIDALDKAMSEKANDVDYFADAYLKITGAYLDNEGYKKLRDERLINVTGDGKVPVDVDFLAKPNADTTQENLVNRLVDSIYQLASVTNMNDDAFAGNPSGVALQMKFRPMKDMADMKALKFESALRKVFECVFSTTEKVPGDMWTSLTFKFTQSTPQNLLELSQAFSYLNGNISKHTLFGLMPFIDDPDKEIQRMKDEAKDEQQNALNTFQDFQSDNNNQTDQQKAGVNDGNKQPEDQDPDKPAD